MAPGELGQVLGRLDGVAVDEGNSGRALEQADQVLVACLAHGDAGQGVLQYPVLSRGPAQRRPQLAKLRDLEAPVLGEQGGHRALQASLDGLDLGDIAGVRHGLTSTNENGRSETVRVAHATRGGTL
jgi:hypothetical protein